MLIFYIVCGVIVFGLSSFLFHRNRLAVYRRRIIRDISESKQQNPVILSTPQEQKIKQCFLNEVTREECVSLLMSEH